MGRKAVLARVELADPNPRQFVRPNETWTTRLRDQALKAGCCDRHARIMAGGVKS